MSSPGFLHSSVGKESACNAAGLSSIPGSGRSAEGTGHPLQCSWASLVAQLVKNPPAMQNTWVRFPGWERSLGEGKGYPLQYSCLENSGLGRQESDSTERLSLYILPYVMQENSPTQWGLRSTPEPGENHATLSFIIRGKRILTALYTKQSCCKAQMRKHTMVL